MQKTAYEMRISDWSSDVCSADRAGLMMPRITESQAMDLEALAIEVKADKPKLLRYLKIDSFADLPAGRCEEAVAALERKRGGKRSEERRVGKECVRKCRSRRLPDP